MKPDIIMPTDAENSAINAGIAADPDTYELSDAAFIRMRPASEVLPELFGEAIASEMLKPKVGRPPKDSPKIYTGIRLDADVLDALRATGKGWQTRVNDVLREWVKSHPQG